MITGIEEQSMPQQRLDEIEFYNYIRRLLEQYNHSIETQEEALDKSLELYREKLEEYLNDASIQTVWAPAFRMRRTDSKCFVYSHCIRI